MPNFTPDFTPEKNQTRNSDQGRDLTPFFGEVNPSKKNIHSLKKGSYEQKKITKKI